MAWFFHELVHAGWILVLWKMLYHKVHICVFVLPLDHQNVCTYDVSIDSLYYIGSHIPHTEAFSLCCELKDEPSYFLLLSRKLCIFCLLHHDTFLCGTSALMPWEIALDNLDIEGSSAKKKRSVLNRYFINNVVRYFAVSSFRKVIS